jgi:hypothetical protein
VSAGQAELDGRHKKSLKVGKLFAIGDFDMSSIPFPLETIKINLPYE